VHPIFLTMHLVRTVTPDGTEIRNYVNSGMASSCSGGGFGTASGGGFLNTAQYNSFSNCMARQTACNNMFFIKHGIVERYTPIGSGGARCMTTAQLRPGFTGVANIQ
jgi:hypothetical protein